MQTQILSDPVSINRKERKEIGKITKEKRGDGKDAIGMLSLGISAPALPAFCCAPAPTLHSTRQHPLTSLS
jgi:hypothetical protein